MSRLLLYPNGYFITGFRFGCSGMAECAIARAACRAYYFTLVLILRYRVRGCCEKARRTARLLLRDNSYFAIVGSVLFLLDF